MSLVDDIKALQANLIPDNTSNQISPKDVRDSLDLILDNLQGLGSNYYGAVTPASSEITGIKEGGTVLPLKDGVYSNFGGLTRSNEICVFVYESGSWVKEKIDDNYIYTSSNDLPTPTSGANVLLANDVPAKYTGEIVELTVNSASSDLGVFQVIERVTVNNINPTAGNIDKFKPIESFDVPLTIGIHTYTLDTPIQIKKGQFLAWASGTGVAPVFYGGDIGTGWWQGGNGAMTGEAYLTYQPIPVAFSYVIKSEKYEVKSKDVVINKVVPVRNANNYNSIRETINSITDASEFNRYEINVPNGEWFEVDIQGKKWVEIIGEDRDKTIIYCDSTLTDAKYVAPSDYSYPAEAGKQLNSINPIYLHVFFNINDQNVSNLTIKQIRGKYAIHSDNPTYDECNFNNCRIIDEQCNYNIGIGMWSGQRLNFNKCIIQRPKTTSINLLGFLMHNAGDQDEKSILNFNECKFINCGYGIIDELNSGQPDEVNVINCTNNNIGQFKFITEAGGDPLLVPYDIKLNASGSRVDYINHTDRPNCIKESITDYDNIAYVLDVEVIKAGDILAYGSYFNAEGNMPVVQKFKSLTGSAPIVGIAIEDNQIDELNPVGFTTVRYVPIGKYAEAFVSGVVGGTSEGKKLEWNNSGEYLEANPSADIRNIIAYALNSKTAGEDKTIIKLL